MTCSSYTYTNCLAYNGVCNRDPEADGVDWLSDNCPEAYNPNQADCDGDGKGDVCDSMNGTFVPSGKKIACASDVDRSIYETTTEVKYHQLYVDISSCHSADRWNQTTLRSHCYGYCNGTEENACEGVCRNDSEYSCDSNICHPIGQYYCNPDTIP
jgi:hypothetical protein